MFTLNYELQVQFFIDFSLIAIMNIYQPHDRSKFGTTVFRFAKPFFQLKNWVITKLKVCGTDLHFFI